MRCIRAGTCAVAIVVLAAVTSMARAAEEAGKTAPTITLVANGRPNAVIVVGKNDIEQACAKELQLYLARISGAAIPIAKKAPRKTRKSVIFVANNRRVKGYKLDTRGLVGSGFRIVTTRKDVILLGRDDKGTESSVRRFLEKYCGVRWHMPGELAVPKRRTVRIERMHVEMGAVSVHGVTYFVAKNGRDSNPGTEAEPWQTIQKATGRLKAGDTVYIRAGTYTPDGPITLKNSGTPGKYITYSAYPGETVTIDGKKTLPKGNRHSGVVIVRKKEYIVISGLRIINSHHSGILLSGASHIIVRGNQTYNTCSSGIGVWGCRDVVVDGNEIQLAGTKAWQECLSVDGSSNIEVRNNHVYDSGNIGGGGGGEGIDIKNGSSHVRVYSNHVHNMNGVGIYVDAFKKHTHDIEVFGNSVHDSPANGIVLASEVGGLLENVRVYNNVVCGNKNNGIVIHWALIPKSPLKGIRVFNNTCYRNKRHGIYLGATTATDIVVMNNICSQNAIQIGKYGTVPMEEHTVKHNLIHGQGSYRGDKPVGGDPRFVDPDKADFRLQQGSPAIDRGSPVDAPEHDFDGNTRRQGAGYDIGAYEYQW